ncbi:MAG TPA: class I SAM-dependent methyltransferase [Patescibacteria group bacterium]
MSFFSRRKENKQRGASSDQHGKSPFDSDRFSLRDLRHFIPTDIKDTDDGMFAQTFAHTEMGGGTSSKVVSESEVDLPIPPGDLSKKLNNPPSLNDRRKLWDETEEEYTKHKDSEMDPVKIFEWAIFAKFLQRIGIKNKTILDLGTGTGLLMRLLNEDKDHEGFNEFARIYGVDISNQLLQKGFEYFGSQHLDLDRERIVFIQALLSEQILANGSCDIVTALNVLDGVPDDELNLAMTNSFRVLKDHGHMAILVRHPKRHGFYVSQGKLRNKEIAKGEEGAYKERWPGASKGVVAYYRTLETWEELLSKNFFSMEGEKAIIGHFEIVAVERTALTREEARRYPELAKRYFDPNTGERRSAGMIVILEKHIDNIADIK